MSLIKSNAKIGVYVDVANMMRNGGYGMQYTCCANLLVGTGARPSV